MPACASSAGAIMRAVTAGERTEAPAPTDPPRVSLVVATRGRDWQIGRLLDSLAVQTRRDFEVLIVDQNADPAPVAAIAAGTRPFAVRHVHTPAGRGISAARNVGWRLAAADLLLFPDDDAWYPPGFLDRGLRLIAELGADLLTGRSADEAGRSINGRFAPHRGAITPRSVWTMQQDWITFVRRSLLERTGGYAETIGIGNPTPWQAGEGPDLILRAIAAGAVCRYDPDLVAHHEELPARRPDAAMLAKARGYARGKGHVLRRHARTPLPLVYWLARPLAGMIAHALRGDGARSRYFLEMALGRWEGWTGRLMPGARAAAHPGDAHERR